MNETVYIETTIPSYLTARPSHDVRILTKQSTTLLWWDNDRHFYDLYISQIVLNEAMKGNEYAAEKRINALRGINMLQSTQEADKMARHILEVIDVSSKAANDALHLALATVHKMDYILTWNFRHLLNPHNIRELTHLCHRMGFETPIICTPESILEAKDNGKS